jgi:hypothetical protein
MAAVGALCLFEGIQALLQASEPSGFIVTHLHPGFPSHWVEGVVRFGPGRVAFGERGNHANPDDNFDVPCSEVIDINANATGDASDRHHMLFHIKLSSKNYNFEIEKNDYQQLRRAFLTEACLP